MKRVLGISMLELLVVLALAGSLMVSIGYFYQSVTKSVMANSDYVTANTDFLELQTTLRSVFGRAWDIAFTQGAASGTGTYTSNYQQWTSCNSCGIAACHADETLTGCNTPQGFYTTGSCSGSNCVGPQIWNCPAGWTTWSCQGTGSVGFRVWGQGAVVVTADTTSCNQFIPNVLAGQVAGQNPVQIRLACCTQNMNLNANVSGNSQNFSQVAIQSACTQTPGLSYQLVDGTGNVLKSRCFANVKSMSISDVGSDPTTQSDIYLFSLTSSAKLASLGGGVGGTEARTEIYVVPNNTAQSLFITCQDGRYLH